MPRTECGGVRERHHRLATNGGREDLRHADSKHRRAAGARDHGVLTNILCSLVDLLRRNREPRSVTLAAALAEVVPIWADGEFMVK